jgi:hypothetical protein
MRTSTFAVFATTLILSASAFAAPSVTPNAGASATVPVQTVRGNAYKMHLGDMAQYKGDYLTDTGRLRVSFEGRKLYAAIGNEQKTEIVPVADNTFVTRDEQTRIVFDALPNASLGR